MSAHVEFYFGIFWIVLFALLQRVGQANSRGLNVAGSTGGGYSGKQRGGSRQTQRHQPY